MFRRILVAVDGSDHSRHAALTAAACCRDWGATLTLVAVYHEPADWEGEPEYSGHLERGMAAAHEILDAAASAVIAGGGPTPDEEVLGGNPTTVILDVAASGLYDLLVMGTRGLGRLQSAVLGSVSAQVAARSPIPVLIVAGAD